MSDYDDYYEFELAQGLNVMAELAEADLEYNPELDQGDPYSAIYERAIYGGDVDPEDIQHFSVYEVDWPNTPKPTDEQIETLTAELDEQFDGWILGEEGKQLFTFNS
jgi:hypothetical protein